MSIMDICGYYFLRIYCKIFNVNNIVFKLFDEKVFNMGKKINNHFELKDVCRSAGLWYVGSFMSEFLEKRDEWENPDTKEEFIKYMFREYGAASDNDISGTRTRVNCIIRIIESNLVIDALNMVLQANDNKLGCDESKVNAQWTLDAIASGELKL